MNSDALWLCHSRSWDWLGLVGTGFTTLAFLF